MHELSIATNLTALAAEAVAGATPPGGRPPRIEAVRVQIGDLSGVVVEALEFAWDVAREGTACSAAHLEIERVPARIRCTPCQAVRTLVAGAAFRCPDCGTPSADIVAGRELELVSLEIDGEAAGTPPRPARSTSSSSPSSSSSASSPQPQPQPPEPAHVVAPHP